MIISASGCVFFLFLARRLCARVRLCNFGKITLPLKEQSYDICVRVRFYLPPALLGGPCAAPYPFPFAQSLATHAPHTSLAVALLNKTREK